LPDYILSEQNTGWPWLAVRITANAGEPAIPSNWPSYG